MIMLGVIYVQYPSKPMMLSALYVQFSSKPIVLSVVLLCAIWRNVALTKWLVAVEYSNADFFLPTPHPNYYLENSELSSCDFVIISIFIGFVTDHINLKIALMSEKLNNRTVCIRH